MQNISYVKYNRLRKKEYQTATYMIEEDGKKYVEKRPLTKEAKEHIEAFQKNYEKLSEMELGYTILKPEVTENAVRFEQIRGENIRDYFCKINDKDQALKEIQEFVNQAFSGATKKYMVTDAFTKKFGNIEGLNQEYLCFEISNIDMNFDNFIKFNDQYICLDYEWVYDFPIPVKYIIYRAVSYFYGVYNERAKGNIDVQELWDLLEITKEDTKIFAQMEEMFQQHVFGENHCCDYMHRYEKGIMSFHDIVSLADEIPSWREKNSRIQHELTIQKEKIDNQQRQIEYLIEKTNKFRKMIKNPLYLAGYVGKKGTKKVLNKVVPGNVKRAHGIIKREGMDAYQYRKNADPHRDIYQTWMKSDDDRRKNKVFASLEYNPLISVVIPVYNVKTEQLDECIESVRNQIYSNWELILVDDASTKKNAHEDLEKYKDDPKIKIKFREKNGHISRTTNDGIAMATGEFVALLDCDDLLTRDALYEMVSLLNKNRDLDFVYSDEDKIDEDGKVRHDPFFKPDWSPDTFMSLMYTCHFSMFRKTILDQLGGMRIGYEGSQDYDLVLRVSEITRNIGHVPMILYHWRTRKESTANDMGAKPYILESTIKAKEDAIKRRGYTGRLEYLEDVCQYRAVYDVKGTPKVSVVIPSKDNYDMLRKCITSLTEKTTYSNYEIIIVDNGSNPEHKDQYDALCKEYHCTYVYQPEAFNFSHMCNTGAQKATGEYVLFLNDDIEITQADWLTRMLGQAQIEYAGAVGCKLIYPGTNLIQHTGVVNYHIGPGHCFHKFDDNLNCYFGRNMLDYNYSIVTAACLLVTKKKFDEIGGFEEKLPIAYNDVEFCFKLVEHGYYNVVRNDVKLVHHESISRGSDESPEKAARLKREAALLYELHPNFVDYDPCYNPNLVKDAGDFSFDISSSKQYTKMKKMEKPKSILKEYGQNIRYTIEAMNVINNELHLQGWCYDRNVNNKEAKVEMILCMDETAYACSLSRRFRPDVSRANGKKGNTAFSGFNAYVQLFEELPHGTYQAYLKINNIVLDINQTIDL